MAGYSAPARVTGVGEYDPAEAGPVGDDVNSAPAVQAAIAAANAAGGGDVVVRRSMRIDAQVHLEGGVRLRSVGSVAADAPVPRFRLWSPTLAAPLIDVSNETGWTIEDLAIMGGGALAGQKAIYGTNIVNGRISAVYCSSFGEQAVDLPSGVHVKIEDLWVQNALLVRGGRPDYIGAVDIGCHDAQLARVVSSTSSAGIDSGNGALAAILIRGGNTSVVDCRAQVSEQGIVVYFTAQDGIYLGNRIDLNYANGVLLLGGNNDFVNNWVEDCGRAANNTYDGIAVQGGNGNTVAFTRFRNVNVANRIRYGVNDLNNAAGAEAGNRYYGNRGTAACVTGLINLGGTGANVIKID